MSEYSLEHLQSLKYEEFEKFVPLNDGDRAVVIKVYDGDTLTIGFLHKSLMGSSTGDDDLKHVRESVRIRGIDTPELRTKSDEERVLALLAKERLEQVALNKIVTLISPDSDKYGRLLCDLATPEVASVAKHMLLAKTFCREYHGGSRQPWN